MKFLNSSILGVFLLTIVACATSSGSSTSYLLTAIQTYNSLDANGDGKLTKSEVSGQLLDNFSTIDSNDDNALTLTELLALKSQLGI